MNDLDCKRERNSKQQCSSFRGILRFIMMFCIYLVRSADERRIGERESAAEVTPLKFSMFLSTVEDKKKTILPG